MQYIAVRWIHSESEDPIELFCELDHDRFEVRKVEVYGDGRIDFACAEMETGDTRLGECEVPPLKEIAADPEFEPREISAAEFEAIWRIACVNRATG